MLAKGKEIKRPKEEANGICRKYIRYFASDKGAGEV